MSTLCNIAKKIEYSATPASKIAQISALSMNLYYLAKVLFRHSTLHTPRFMQSATKSTERRLPSSSIVNHSVLTTFFQNIDSKVYDLLFLSQKIKKSLLSYANCCAHRSDSGILLISLNYPQSNIQNTIHHDFQAFVKIEASLQKYLPPNVAKHCQKTLT